MFFLIILTFVNALAHNDGFALRYRIGSGFPIGVFDGLLAVGLLLAIITRRAAMPTDRIHPLLNWIVILFTLATLGGVLGSFVSKAELRWVLTTMRNLLTLPATVLLGYSLLYSPRSSERFPFWQVLAGVGTALVILLFFHAKAASTTSTDINLLRAVAYVTNYAGIAATLLLFTIIANVRLFPTWLAIGLCGFCFIGQLATLSRSDWLATMAGVIAIYVLLPSFRPRGKLVAALVGPPLIVLFVWVGLIFATAVTGRDFEKLMGERLATMLPGDTPGVKVKAWESRLEGIQKELNIWVHSPLTGGGFGAQDILRFRRGEAAGFGYRHNTWISTLAETGLVGFAAMCSVVFGQIIIGRRLVRDAWDRGQVLVGALGVITGVHFLFLGLATQSFNQMRWAIPLGLICGVVLRTRAMQLTLLRQYQASQYTTQDVEYERQEETLEPSWGGAA